MNHYQLLGVASNANTDQISRAYINVCKRYKSTLNYGPELSFEEVYLAYKVLTDPDARRVYDESLPPVKDKILPKNVVPVTETSAPAPEVGSEWIVKDYSGIKEWVHDFRIPSSPRFAQTTETVVLSVPTPRVATASSPTNTKSIKYNEPRKTSKGRKVFIALLIFLAFTGIPVEEAFFVGLGLNAALAGLYSILGACVFSIACLKTSSSSPALTATNVRKRRNYQAPTRKIYQSLTPAVRRNLMDAEFALKCKIWGMPGILDDAVEKFGQRNIELGTAGEELTARMLEDLLKIPGTRIFHGLKFPGSNTADVDHAIINGDKIVFIDSKMWVGAHYKWIRPDTIGRVRRKEFKEIHTNFPAAVGYLSQTFNKQQIKAMTIIHSNNNYRVSFDNSNSSGVQLTSGQDAIRDIGNWFSKDLTGKIDLNAMQKLEYQLK